LGLLGFLLLLLVPAVAGGARAGYLIFYADNAGNEGPLLVQDAPALVRDVPAKAVPAGQRPPNELDALVNNLKDSNSYSSLAPFAQQEEQTAHYSPGYPWLLGWASQWFNLGEAERNRWVRWAQCGLGALTAAVYFLFAWRAFASRTVATLTGLFCAVYPFWVINTATIDDGVLTSFLVGVSLYLGARAMATHGPFASLLYGLALAGLALVRASTLPFAFVALGWFLLRSRHESRGWLCALLAFLGFANGLVPWTVRNYTVFGKPIPIVDSTYLHLWIGNNPKATGGPATEAMWFDGLSSDRREKLLALKDDQPGRYMELGPDVWKEVAERPVTSLQRRFQAFLDFLVGERYFTDHRLADERIPGEGLPGSELTLNLTLFGLLFFALLGWRWSYGWRKDAVPAALAFLWLPLPYILSHAEALHGPRLPLDGVLLCYAAFAVACLLPGIGGNLLEARKPKTDEVR